MIKLNITNKYLKVSFGIIGAILIGAIGSGVWENLLSPFFEFLVKISIQTFTLGRKVFLDSIYEDIAKGFSDKYSIRFFYFFESTLFAILIITLFFAKRSIKKIIFSYKEEHEKTEEESKYSEKNLKRKILLTNIILFLLLITFSSIFIEERVNLYKNNAIVHIEQSLRIIMPYLSQKEINQLKSQFALIKSKEDYVELDKKLRDIARDHSTILPDFEIF